MNTEKDGRITVEELLFYIYFMLMLITKGIGLVDGPIYRGLIYLASLVALAKLAMGSYNRLQKVMIAMLLLLSGIILVHAGNQGVMICVLWALGMKNVPLKRAFTVGGAVWCATFLFQLVRGLSGLGTPDYVIHQKLGFDHVIRWGMGYSHPNVFLVAYVALVMYLFYALLAESGSNTGEGCEHGLQAGDGQSRPGNHKTGGLRRMLIVSGVFAAGAFYVFVYTLSVTGMLMYICFMVFFLYFEGNRMAGRRRSILEQGLLYCIFPAAAGVSIIGPVLLKGKAFDLINRLLTTRPALTKHFLENYGVSLLGEDLSKLDFHYTLDCSYANLLMQGGLLIFLVMLAAYAGTIHDALHQKPSAENSVRLAILFAVVISAMSEPFAFNTSYKNVSLLLVGDAFFRWTDSLGGTVNAISPTAGLAAGWPARLQKKLEAMGRFEVKLPGIAGRLLSETGDQAAGFSGGLTIRHLAAGLAGGVALAAILFATAPMPRDIYAQRRNCDRVDGYPEMYLSAEAAQELAADENVWLMDYKDPETLMTRFTDEDIMPVERARRSLTGLLAGFALGCWGAALPGRKPRVTGLL